MNAFFRAYLDAPVDRRGTHCEKWDGCKEYFGSADVLPMWVADMDFRTVPAIRDALVARAEHAIYGYTENGLEEKAAETEWYRRRYGLEVAPDWILYSPGVVDSIFFCVRALTEPGEAVLIQPPVYGPFYRAAQLLNRKLVKSPLIHNADGWQMDFDGIEQAFKSGVKLMILCSPHNPVGRIWTREELSRLVELANRYGVYLICDEIHADFQLDGPKHTRILSLADTDRCVMLTSATKSFNLAGLRQSSAVIRDPALRERVAAEITRAHAGTPNIFGAIAQMTAYREGDAWMDAVVEYVRENRDYVCDFLAGHIPEITCEAQHGSYLMWLDCRGTSLTHEEFYKKLIEEAHVGLNNGLDYGEEGRGYFRLNLATQRARVEQTMTSIEKMVRSMNQ